MITSNLTDISSTARCILDCIVRFSYKTGVCFADNRTIGENVGKSMSCVSHNLTALEDKGYIERKYIYQGKWIIARETRVLARGARGIVKKSGVQSDSVKDNKNTDAEAVDNSDNLSWQTKVLNAAARMGLNVYLVAKLAGKYGKRLVAEKLQMLANTKSKIRNAYGWLVSACENNWTPSKKAKENMNKVKKAKKVMYYEYNEPSDKMTKAKYDNLSDDWKAKLPSHVRANLDAKYSG